ncbi:MAG: hypothetical protein J6M62_05435 [Selenomonadaceae bacterium]|nr:hypothetical protein [Selenomonadaceae bacterium]
MRRQKFEKDVFCPLVNRDIGDLLCEDIAYVSEKAIPARFAPKEFRNVPNFEKICMACANHQE